MHAYRLLAPQLANSNKRVLDILEASIKDFLNNKRWSADALASTGEDRLQFCNYDLRLGRLPAISKQRLRFNRTGLYSTAPTAVPLLNISDKDFDFTYSEGQPLDFSEQNYISNLSSLLAFYAYIITGMDYDTFSKFGGTPYFEKAQTVLNNAQTAPNGGWKAFENLRNRFWLIENLTNKSYNPIRESLYIYHREGLDVMAENQSKGRKSVLSVIPQLQKIDKQKQGSILNQIFFTAKADEIINILGAAEPQEKIKAYNALSVIDPANSLKYEILKKP
jgi:hypothetical protein